MIPSCGNRKGNGFEGIFLGIVIKRQSKSLFKTNSFSGTSHSMSFLIFIFPFREMSIKKKRDYNLLLKSFSQYKFV